MAQVYLTNQVIPRPREVLEQWEGEADASYMRGRVGSKSWSEYVGSESWGPLMSYIAIGLTCCIPVYLLHLPFRRCPQVEDRDMSFEAAFENTLCCGWCGSYNGCFGCRCYDSGYPGSCCCPGFDWCGCAEKCGCAGDSCLIGNACNASYHDWLHGEDARRRHRESYVAKRAAEYATLGLRGT